MTLKALRIATRGSALALWQANHVKALLESASPGASVEIQVIRTSGDRIQDRALVEVGGKGLFVKEIQTALLERTADLAVHSLKDYPAENPGELTLACIPERQDPRDALVLPAGKGPDGLCAKPSVGTGSLRRKHQLALLHPAWQIVGLRGNVDTRLRKVDSGELDAAVLAAAGLKRLGHAGRITRLFSLDEMVPAVGQGALAIEARRDSAELLRLLATLEDAQARRAIDAERRFLGGLGASCTTPLGIHAELAGERVTLRAFLSTVEGDRHLTERAEGPASDVERLVDGLLDSFWKRGAASILGRA
jgi:hydroxymethylbilane synthase